MIKKHLWAVCFSAVLVAFTAYIALDTFVFAASYNTNAVEMNTAMFAEASSDRTESIASSDSGVLQPASAEASVTQRAGSHAQTDDTAANESETETGTDSATGASETQSGSASGEPAGWGWGWGGPSGGPRPGSRRSGSSENADSSSASSGWGSSDWSGSSGWGGRRSGRGSMSSAESAAGVDAAAEYSGDTTYQDDNVTITLKEYNQNDTRIYVADVTVTSTQYIKAAFASDTYGKNVTESTSAMAAAHNAILAVNGDYYGAQERGFVIRNGVVYRSTSAGKDVMCIYADGTMGIVSDREITAEELVANGVWQAFSFGPALIEDGIISVTQFDEVGMGMISNPRTAVGMIDTNHFIFVVSDGRTDESAGLSLYELAQFMQSLGVKTAYNLDGGGSSTMYFNGQIVNNPTSFGGGIKERGVSDIVYIG